MNNLTTRKMVLGMLLAFVLAFGVQGTADAVQYPNEDEGTLISIPAEPYTINEDTPTLTLTFTDDKDDKIEKVTITISSGILLTTSDQYGERTVTLTESDVNGNIPSLTVQGRFLAGGKQTITVEGTDYNKVDDPEGFRGGSWTQTYVYYVTQPAPNVNTATINLANLSNGYKAEVYRDISIYGGDGKHYAVMYDPNDGLTYKIPGRTDDIDVPETAISSAFKVSLRGDTDSDVITAEVRGSKLSTTGAYFYGQPVLTEPGPTTPGTVNALLPDAFTATVVGGDDPETGLAGILVKFEVSDKTSAGGNLVFTEGDGSGGILVDRSNKQVWDAGRNMPATTGGGKTLYIRTGSDGAKVDFRLGTAAEQKVTISAVGKSKEVSAFTDVSENYELSLDEIQDISGKYGLYVLAEKAEEPLQLGWDVVFTTARGVFEGTGTSTTDFTAPTDGGRRIVQHTNEQGIAYVIFDPKGSSGPLEVTASIKNDEDYEDDDAITVAQLTFDALSGAPNEPLVRVARLSISVTSTGATRTVTVNALTAAGQTISVPIVVTLSGTALTLPRQVITGTATAITLPSTVGVYTLLATDGSGLYAQGTALVTVAAPAAPGTLSITAIGTVTNLQQTVEVSATNAAGTGVAGVSVTLTGPFFTTQTVTTLSTGSVRVIVTIPSATGLHTLTASAVQDIIQVRLH